MNSDVKTIKKLLNINSFVLTNKGRLPMTKVIRKIQAVPKDIKQVFGELIKRNNRECYIFKSNRTVSNIAAEGPSWIFSNTPQASFWNRNEPSEITLQTSSQKLIDEFIEFLTINNVSISSDDNKGVK